jgi:hypothetical protein
VTHPPRLTPTAKTLSIAFYSFVSEWWYRFIFGIGLAVSNTCLDAVPHSFWSITKAFSTH